MLVQTKQIKQRVCVRMWVRVCVCLPVNTHPLVTGVSVSLWNCLCCHCWRIGWTSVSSAFSETQVWTAAFWAVQSSSSPLNLYRGLILIHPCCHRKSTRVWLQLHWFHCQFHCTYSTRACRRCHWESSFCPFGHCCLWGPRAPTGTETEAELDRDKKKSVTLKQKRAPNTLCTLLHFTTHNLLLNNSQQISPDNTDHMAEEIQKEISVIHVAVLQKMVLEADETLVTVAPRWVKTQVQEINAKKSKV